MILNVQKRRKWKRSTPLKSGSLLKQTEGKKQNTDLKQEQSNKINIIFTQCFDDNTIKNGGSNAL